MSTNTNIAVPLAVVMALVTRSTGDMKAGRDAAAFLAKSTRMFPTDDAARLVRSLYPQVTNAEADIVGAWLDSLAT